nr:cation transporter [Betaproteobacteria bacterium]
MSSSVSISIATNSAIAAAKGFGWVVTGSPTLFAETVHSLADVGNQVLLKVGEIRGKGGPDHLHPFGRGQEKFFWALVSAVSVFFIGCGINLYHGIHSLTASVAVEPFTPLIIGLLLFSLALESYTPVVAYKEIGGLKG